MLSNFDSKNAHLCTATAKVKLKTWLYSLLPLSGCGFLKVEVRCKSLATDAMKPATLTAQGNFVLCNSLLHIKLLQL